MFSCDRIVSMKGKVWLIALIVSTLGPTPDLQAATIYVKQDGSGADGLTWQTAFQTIGEAIAGAQAHDSIWAASGVYEERLKVEIPLQIYGGFRGDEAFPEERDLSAHETVLHGTGVRGSLLTVRSDLVVDGFTFKNGVSQYGGGVSCYEAAIEILNCRFIENRLSGIDETHCMWGPFGDICTPYYIPGKGGAAYFEKSLVAISDSEFIGNRSDGSYAGGLYLEESTLDLARCHFESNKHPFSIRDGEYLTINACTFQENTGYILIASRTPVFMSNTSIIGNISSPNGQPISFSEGSNVDNCLITNNVSSSRIIKLTTHYTSNTISNNVWHNCTITDNKYIYNDRSNAVISSDSLSMTNCILWNSGSEIRGTSIEVTHSIVRGGFPGNGNLDEDPRFVDPEGGDYRLLRNSPAIDSSGPTDLATDLDGNPRPVDLIGFRRDGDEAFDIGCYEFQLKRSDLNSDGWTNELDLMIFQQDWMKVSGASGGR